MKTYLIKKEIKSIWKWALIASAIQFIGFIIGESFGTSHSIIEVPLLMLSGKLAQSYSPLFESATFFGLISILTAIVLPFVQIHPEIQGKTITFLLHRPVSKSDVLNAKIVSGLVMLILSIGAQLSFMILVCSIPGNYAAPFEFDMIFNWFLFIYFSCIVYLAILFCCLQEGKFKKWLALFSLPFFFWLLLFTTINFSIWLQLTFYLTAISLWYLAVCYSFEERDFS